MLECADILCQVTTYLHILLQHLDGECNSEHHTCVGYSPIRCPRIQCSINLRGVLVRFPFHSRQTFEWLHLLMHACISMHNILIHQPDSQALKGEENLGTGTRLVGMYTDLALSNQVGHILHLLPDIPNCCDTQCPTHCWHTPPLFLGYWCPLPLASHHHCYTQIAQLKYLRLILK